jgi:hypothetical protein
VQDHVRVVVRASDTEHRAAFGIHVQSVDAAVSSGLESRALVIAERPVAITRDVSPNTVSGVGALDIGTEMIANIVAYARLSPSDGRLERPVGRQTCRALRPRRGAMRSTR